MEYDLKTYRQIRMQFLNDLSIALNRNLMNGPSQLNEAILERELGDLFVRHFPPNGLPTTLPQRNSR
jgi:hypothetical protein